MQIFGDVGQAVSQIFQKKEKIVNFCDKTSQSNVNNFFSIRGRMLHDSSF